MKRVFIIFAGLVLLCFIKCLPVYALPGERILYSIRPFGGSAEYRDEGPVKLEGKPANLVIFKVDYLGFVDTERIYCEPKTFLALRVERDVSGWFGKEHIVEEYDQKTCALTITKFKEGKQVAQQVVHSGGPIYNGVTLPFYIRRIAPLPDGWSFNFRIPDFFEVALTYVDAIRISGHAYRAYRFVSKPQKFELWVDSEAPFIPLKIKGKGGLSYTLTLKEYNKD